eukprot:CAMPEP_0116575746 /NCGR_PEP_ID=MMETSP0397-20121206/20124_1 /TAXON_ID=216820 /ORGANISM="Cyclophora tenuis, Strain ECT3854" /LENGTH=98 /DNA_ID=CAMNT_0004104663 /DNA_START=140 /DNA_END=432 /DNA_ORIENTATION=-
MALKQLHADSELMEMMNIQQKGRRRVLLGAYANRLTPVAKDWELSSSDGPQPMRSDLGPKDYLSYAQQWTNQYHVQLLGGCCGITPKHIALLHKELSS